MSVPCPTCLPLDCTSVSDEDLYSIESGLFPFVLNCPPGFDCNGPGTFSIVCCGSVLSTTFPPNATIDDRTVLIQEVLNQCAVRNTYCGTSDIPHNPPDQPIQLYYNNPKTCTVDCPDGSPFTYTIPAGAFAGDSQVIVDQQAQDAACIRANQLKVCLGNLSGCLCVGSPYSYRLTTTGGIGPFVWSIWSGSLPTGLSIDQTGTISGTPTASGNFSFVVQVTEPDGSYMRKTYTLAVLEITTVAITGFTVGSPFSFQMQAAGGSGSYNWTITSGTLPDGLTMSLTGLISGTPTNSASSTLTFKVIDTNCESATQSFFPPNIKLVTTSQTKIATVLGFPEYIPSLPPKKYHTLTWAGTSEQQLWFPEHSVGNPGAAYQIAGSKFDYAGSSTIDGQGNYTSLYTKNLSSMCQATGNLVTTFLPGVNGGFENYVFTGWLGPTINQKCTPPGIPYSAVGDQAIGKGSAAIQDFSKFWGSKKPDPAVSNAQISDFNPISSVDGFCLDAGGDKNDNAVICLFEPVVQGVIPGITGSTQGTVWFFGGIVWDHDYTSQLTGEYTDAEALANAQVINGNGATAQTFPRTTGFISSFTTVTFKLNCSNLLVNKDYLVSYDLWDQTAGTISTVQIGFTAVATTKTINGTVPTPANGHSITVRNPKIIFSP